MSSALRRWRTMRHWLRLEDSPLPLYAVALMSAYFIAAYAIIAVMCVGYPYQLEWLEGAVMDGVQQVLRGMPIYAKPTLHYAPLIYTPLYYYVTAAFTYLFGNTLVAGRMVSLSATIATCALLFAWIWKEKESRLGGLAAVALFLSTYEASGRWFHVARVDGLCLALTLGGFFVYFHYRSAGSAIAAGLLLALAFFTKQQALPMAMPAMLLGIVAYPKRTLIVLASLLLAGGLAAAICEYSSDGWFGIYVFEVPWVDAVSCRRFADFWQEDILRYVPVSVGLSATGALLWLAQDWRRGLLYLGLMGGALGSALASRMHCGGWSNVLMPAFAVLSLTGVLAAHDLMRAGALRKNICYILLLVQMLMLAYNPFGLIPAKANYAAGKKLMDYIAAQPGDVLIPDMRFMQAEAGKASYGFSLDSGPAEKIAGGKASPTVRQQLRDALSKQRFSALVLTYPGSLPEKNRYYRYQATILLPAEQYLLAGAQIVPRYVFVPIAPRAADSGKISP